MPHALSVNSVCNALVTCRVVGKIKEFTTAGKLIRVISLQSDVVNPWHTVELTRGKYIVCHGLDEDPLNIHHRPTCMSVTRCKACSGQIGVSVRVALEKWETLNFNRVYIIDSSGCVLQSYGGSRGSGSGQLNVPLRLAVIVGLVADCGNHRVLMLSESLSYILEVVSGLRDPLRNMV